MGKTSKWGIFPSHLSTLSQSQCFDEDTDPRRILSRLWLQLKVRHCQTQRSHTPVQTSRKHPRRSLTYNSQELSILQAGLGGVRLPLVSASKSCAPAVVAVSQKTLPPNPQDRTATLINLGEPER